MKMLCWGSSMKKNILVVLFFYSSLSFSVAPRVAQPLGTPIALFNVVRSLIPKESFITIVGKGLLASMRPSEKKREKKSKEYDVGTSYMSPVMRSLLLTMGVYLMIYDKGKIPITVLAYLKTAGETIADSEVVG